MLTQANPNRFSPQVDNRRNRLMQAGKTRQGETGRGGREGGGGGGNDWVAMGAGGKGLSRGRGQQRGTRWEWAARGL